MRYIAAALSTAESIEGIKQRCRIPSVVERLTVDLVDVPQATQSERDALQVLLEAEAAAVSAEFKASPDRRTQEHRRAKSIPNRRRCRRNHWKTHYGWIRLESIP